MSAGLQRSVAVECSMYFSRRRMEHPNILPRKNMHQSARFDVPYLDEARLEREDVRVRQRKRHRVALPRNLPIRTRPPAVAIDEERKLGIVQEELAIEPFEVDGFDVLLPCDKVQRRIGLVEEGLRFERLDADDFKSTGATNAELGLEEVDGR